MTEGEARTWIATRYGVPRETLLAAFADMVIAESAEQNLVSASSLASLWHRHIVDSAQLLDWDDGAGDTLWVDIGTGAGFPGMVVALLTERPVMLIEPRRRRADFLQRAVDALGVAVRITIAASRVEQVVASAGVISARAVAALPELLGSAAHLATKDTIWLLPKGRRAREEVAAARQTWHGVFHVEQSITETGSLIVKAKGVSRR